MMAKNNRDRLIDTFLSRNRNLRKTKPAGLRGYQPMPTGGENAVFFRSQTVPPNKDPRRPYQQFVGVGGKQAMAPAGSGPLNPVRPRSRYYLGKGAAKYKKGRGRPD